MGIPGEGALMPNTPSHPLALPPRPSLSPSLSPSPLAPPSRLIYPPIDWSVCLCVLQIIDELRMEQGFTVRAAANTIEKSQRGYAGLLNAAYFFMPQFVKHRISDGLVDSAELSEIRQVSVMFINCKGLVLAAAGGDFLTPLQAGQAVASLVQRTIYEHEGSINKMLVTPLRSAAIASRAEGKYSSAE